MGNSKSRMLMANLTEFETKFGNKIYYGQFREHNRFNFNGKLYKFNFLRITPSIDYLDLSLTLKQNWCLINIDNKGFYQWSIFDKNIKYIASTIVNKFVCKKFNIDYRDFTKLHLILPVNFKQYKLSDIPENLKNKKFENIINSLAISDPFFTY